ncbi:hypothetical protein [Isosphaera pallida]|uniref:hypothetical protein n=1 Tax=Isosphaera pallida TaxID=128 RepID=UPI0002E49BE6|nr:hypothetical protein [Isosphaera pallida]
MSMTTESSSALTFKAINEARLERDLGYRFGYLTEFMGWTEADEAAVHGAAVVLAPLVPRVWWARFTPSSAPTTPLGGIFSPAMLATMVPWRPLWRS